MSQFASHSLRAIARLCTCRRSVDGFLMHKTASMRVIAQDYPLTLNQRVEGSSPSRLTKQKRPFAGAFFNAMESNSDQSA